MYKCNRVYRKTNAASIPWNLFSCFERPRINEPFYLGSTQTRLPQVITYNKIHLHIHLPHTLNNLIIFNYLRISKPYLARIATPVVESSLFGNHKYESCIIIIALTQFAHWLSNLVGHRLITTPERCLSEFSILQRGFCRQKSVNMLYVL